MSSNNRDRRPRGLSRPATRKKEQKLDSNEALKPPRETDETYLARINEAARRVVDLHCTANEMSNPDYVAGFENGFLKALHTLPTSVEVYTFGGEGANRAYDDGFREALAHLGCNWIGDPEG